MQQQDLVNAITPAVKSLGLDLWGCEFINRDYGLELWVYVDSEKGATLDACVEASRQISAILDVEDLISGAYQLQVSSPGMNRRLFTPEQYTRYIGRKLKIRTFIAHNGARNFRGVLVSADDTQITLKCDQNEDIQLQFSQIDKAHVVPEF